MDEIMELVFECPEGMIDCRLEAERNEDVLSYNVTILYPGNVNGYSRSEIYCHNLCFGAGSWSFDAGDDTVLPKIKKLATQLSDAIIQAQLKRSKK